MPSQLKRILFISQKNRIADQSKIIPFDEYIFIARCELSRDNKNEKTKPYRKHKGNHQKPVLGVS